jgi:hypothetical protein
VDVQSSAARIEHVLPPAGVDSSGSSPRYRILPSVLGSVITGRHNARYAQGCGSNR